MQLTLIVVSSPPGTVRSKLS
eukprot:COSAG04_NODE_21545_length_371_cov_1.511029_2_plen_20_part_01